MKLYFLEDLFVIYIRAAIATTCLLLAALIIYMLMAFNSDYELSLAADAFLKGDYMGSEKIMNKIRNDIPPAEYYLYTAYNSREKSTLQESTEQLKQAEQAAQNEPRSAILLEIYLNQALNAYLTLNPEAMVEPLKNARANSKSNDWVSFFTALQEYQKDNYEPALKEWQKPIHKGFLSPWMKKTFEDTFNDFWFSTYIVRANIAKGDYLQARQKLEQASKKATEAQLNDINLMLGLSYLKEAEEKPVVAATPYYKLALSYINRIPIQNGHYASYRKQIVKILQNQLNGLIDNGAFQDLSFYAGIMERWNDKAGLENLNERLIDQLNQKVKANDWKTVKEILTTLNHLVTNPEQRQGLEKKFEDLFNNALKDENFTYVEKYWEAMRLFSEDPEALSRKVADQTAGYILQLIPIDNQELSLTSPYLEFWMSIEKDPAHRYAFASELLDIAEKLWTMDNQPDKALMLAKLALTLPGLKDQAAFHQHLAATINKVYAQAQSQSNLHLLQSILKAKEELHLGDVQIQDHINTSKQLNDATKLFDNKRYPDAKEKALWVLQLDPLNQKALRIEGLVDYYQADYSSALMLLRKIQHPDDEAKEALAVTELLNGDADKGKKLLAQISKNRSAGNDVYLRLGLGLLASEEPVHSIEWLNKIPVPGPEALAGKSFAYFEARDWKNALEAYNKLQSPYKDLLGMKNIAIESMAALGNITEAENMLQGIQSNPKQPADTEFPPLFVIFKKELLDNQTPDFIAGMFYKIWMKDNVKALEYLKKIPNPDPLVLVEIGAILSEQHKYFDARASLLKGLNDIQENPIGPYVLKKALPFIANVNYHLGYYPDSVEYYEKFYKAFPNDAEQRFDYASALMELRRFDAALEQFTSIEKNRSLVPQEKIDLIACLVHLDRFKDANKKTSEYLSSKPSLPLAEQVKLAKWMVIIGDVKNYNEIMKRIPEQSGRSLDVNKALIELWIEKGDYEKASSLIKSIQPELEKTSDGLMLIATLYARLSSSKNALKFAQKALELDPYNLAAAKFIEPYELELPAIKQRLANIQKLLESDPNNVTLQMEYSRGLIDMALEINLADPNNTLKNLPELNKAYLVLKDLSEKHKDIPRLYLLLGESEFLQNEDKKAEEAFKTALKLDVSYTEAYKYLSLIYAEIGHFNEAFESIKNALKYNPGDSEAWVEMANLFQREENGLDAIASLQRAIKYKPNDTVAYVNLGQLQLGLEEPEEARESLETALKLSPNNIKALKLLLVALHHPLLDLRR